MPGTNLPLTSPAPKLLSPGLLRPFHWRLILLVGLSFASSGQHLGVLSFALIGLRADWGLQPMDTATLMVVAMVGQMLGSIVVGIASDRFGRRGAFALSALVLGAFTGLGGLMPSLPWLLACVFVAGVGMGGGTPAGLALLGEFAPPARRGFMVGLLEVTFASGWLLAAISGAVLVGAFGWRAVYFLGALPALLALAVWRFSPESPRFLLAHGRRVEARALVEHLNTRFGLGLGMPEQERHQRQHPLRGLLELWSPRFRRRTAMLWLAWGSMQAGFNGPMIWLPLLLVGAGLSDELASRLGVVVAVAYIVPALVAVLLLDVLGRKPVLAGALFIAALGALLLASASGLVLLVAGAVGLSIGLSGAWTAILVYIAELYPTRVRGMAAGWSGAAGRVVGLSSPIFLSLTLSSWEANRGLAIGAHAALLVAGTLTTLVLGVETRGRTLEDTSA